MPFDFLITLVGEFGKGLMGELGKSTGQKIVSRGERTLNVPDREAEELDHDPLADAEEVAGHFWTALSHRDHEAALSWCDPAWGDDPVRNQNLVDALDSAQAVSWSTRLIHLPDGWTEGEWLDWAALEMVVTFDLGDGSFTTLPLLVWMIPGDEGWQVADINWDSASEPEPELELDFLVQCERCPNHLAVPPGSGPYRIKCPECWTPQTIDRDALA